MLAAQQRGVVLEFVGVLRVCGPSNWIAAAVECTEHLNSKSRAISLRNGLRTKILESSLIDGACSQHRCFRHLHCLVRRAVLVSAGDQIEPAPARVAHDIAIVGIAQRADVKERPSDVVDFLCELAFLGVEVEQDRFEFLFDEGNKEKIYAMANRNATQNPSGLKRYCINRAYHKYLEIKPGDPSPRQEIIPL